MSQTTTTPAEKGQDKRERIFRAAIEVFAQRGFFNARVSEVAKAAGVADGTIYLYFDGKEDLLVQVFRDGMRTFLDVLDRELEPIRDPRSKLERTIRYHLETIGRDRELAIVVQVELRHSLKFMSLFSHQELADYLNLLRSIVEEGQKKNVFRTEIHPQMAAKAIFGVLDEMVTSWVLSEKHSRLEDSADQVCEILLGGLDA
ncbi:MAG: TetR/AcrR family transcriptional regulator [Thermoanaerobaculia bacterium]|nr:TetR/AcrR family transcriptional regulator [Thermoanaerobaculia bacterium]